MTIVLAVAADGGWCMRSLPHAAHRVAKHGASSMAPPMPFTVVLTDGSGVAVGPPVKRD